MRLTTSIVLSALFIFTNVKADLNERCRVQNIYDGICTYLTGCPYYDNMIQNYKSLGLKPRDVFELFRKINCGFVMSDALVCCPPDSYIQGLTPPPDNAVPQGTNNQGPILQPTNPPSSGLPEAPPVPTTQAPVTLPPSTTAPVMGSPPDSGFSNTSTTQTDKPTVTTTSENPNVATTPAAPPTTTRDPAIIEGLDIEKFKRLLPEECGRVIMFKYFRGNRTEFDDFPWTTLIEYETPSGKQFGCGGALINSRYVLTAAHCVTGLSPSRTVSRVRFGEYDTHTDIDCLPDGPNMTICNRQPLDVAVEEIIAHSGFTPTDPSRLHDIALLRLSEPVNFTYTHKPICLPTKNPFPQKYYTSGWGKDLVEDSIRNGTNLKYMSYVSLTDQEYCQKIYTEGGVKISQSQICGGNPSEKPCIGDAGGPLMGLEEIPSLQKRVAAFGVLSLKKPATGDCKRGNPGVYTKVLDYMDWILYNLKE